MQSTTTLAHELAITLRTDVLRGRYAAGERLPSERDLAAHFGASRGAVREALSQLEQLRLIRVLPGGARVCELETASLSVLGPLLELEEIPNAELVDQFLETFAALACQTTRSAVQRASDDELKQLERRVQQLASEASNLDSLQQGWRELMEQLGAIADNLVVKLISNDLRAQFFEHMLQIGIRPQLPASTAREVLENLAGAIAQRDSELAASCVLRHFDALRTAAGRAIGERLHGEAGQVAAVAGAA